MRKNDAIDDRTLEILSALEILGRGSVRISEPLDRKEYRLVNDVLVALGGAWSKRDRAHIWPDQADARSLIDQTITEGAIPIETDLNLGHFESPPSMADWLVEHGDVRPGMSALEPSAGNGRIVNALLSRGAIVSAVERVHGRRERLAAVDADLRRGPLFVSDVDDFMEFRAGSRGFDRIIMNPPFCRSGRGDHLDHVNRAHMMLAPGGILVSVMPASLSFRRDLRYSQLRALCEERGSITPLPDGSFLESGTAVRTVAIRIEAKAAA